MLNAILEVFNDILMLRSPPPQVWKQTKLTVIFKKGDPELPQNYRPIAIVPILYKLFSRMFCKRMVDLVMRHQSVDQAAYRKGFSAEDQVFTVTQLIEKSWEFSCPLWLGLVNFEKAFDTVEHPALWDVLQRQGVPLHYISLLRSLYKDQSAEVQGRSCSRSFSITRGVKQGDPFSALLFIAIMEDQVDRSK